MDHDATLLNEVVLPLMNVSRRTRKGLINPYEPQQVQYYLTSAGQKSSYAYERLIELYEMQIYNPKGAFVWGCDYRVPMMHGLLPKSYLQEVKMSSTFKDDSFAREYLAQWTGGGTDSWFDYDKMTSYRKLFNPESKQNCRGRDDIFYLLAVDVGRLSCQTVVTVFKVFTNKGNFKCSLVNIYILGLTPETKHFEIQARDLKMLIQQFQPKEVVVDANGIGCGLMDYMVKPSRGPNGELLPAYRAFNDDDYGRKLYPDAIDMIYALKDSKKTKGLIHSNCYTRVFTGRVQFLAREQEVKTKLLATKKGAKMKLLKRQERIRPHELTTRLFEEISNFKIKQSATGALGSEIVLEKINTNMLSDKFSSFEYGLWRIKQLEEDYSRRNKRRKRQLVFIN